MRGVDSLTTRMLLRLLRDAQWGPAMRPRRTPPGQAGFSMAMTMLVLLTLILGTVAVASRTTSGLLSTNLQSKNREARDIAEAGIVQIVSELNKEQNRKMLVLGTAPSSWSETDPLAVNPCTKYDSSGTFNASLAQQPTSTAINYKSGWKTLAGSSTQQFQLESVTYSDQTRTAFTTPSTDVTKGITKSLVKFTVLGRVIDASNNVISTSRVTREFQVVPKCCKRSFGMNQSGATEFGPDIRTCYNDGSAGGVGVVMGINGGTLNTSNNSISMVDPTNVPVTKVLCRKNQGQTACDNGTWKLGSSVSVVPTDFTLTIPGFPDATITTLANVSVSGTQYIRVNNSTNIVEKCNLSGSTLGSCNPINTTDNTTACVSSGGQYHCRINTIDSKNNNLIIDTSNGIINLYFNNSATSGTKYLDLGGNGTIQQVYCSSGQTGTAACGTTAPFSAVDRLNFFTTGAGSFDIGGTSAAVAMNLYAPFASVNMNGGGSANPNFQGRIWTNNLVIKGNVKLQVPNSLPTFCNSATPGVGCPPAASSPDIDWVARSVSQSSAF